MTEFHQNIKILRKRKGVIQKEVGEVVGKTQNSVTKWEGGGEGNYTDLVKLSDFFGVTIDDLLKKDLSKEEAGEGEPSESKLMMKIASQSLELDDLREEKLKAVELVTQLMELYDKILTEDEEYLGQRAEFRSALEALAGKTGA